MTGASAAGTRRSGFRRIDWHRAAELLAAGQTIATTADQVGCSRSQLSRRRNHDPVFQCWIENARARGNPLLTGLRKALHAAIEKEVGKGNVRVVLWLADRLKFVAAPDERTPAHELQALLGNLTTEELREFEELRDPETA
jgi:Helix-turn-helix domain of resolvase